MQDYKNEVKTFFSGDEQLAAEVEFILRSAEKQQELEEQLVNCSLAEPQKSTEPAEVERRSITPINVFFILLLVCKILMEKRNFIQPNVAALWPDNILHSEF